MRTLVRRHGLAPDIVDALVGHARRSVPDRYGEFEVAALSRELAKMPALSLRTCAARCRFLQEKVGPWYESKRQKLEGRPLLRSQALGQALDPDRLAGLARYEVHLD